MTRTTFSTSRLLDFASVKELTAQTGHEDGEWPLVIVKELLDNALDACRGGRRCAGDHVQVDAAGSSSGTTARGFRLRRSGASSTSRPGSSSREAYVSPTRGAQGNALKTILAMPFVLDGERGQVEIAAQGERHRIAFKVDRIRQVPVVDHRGEPDDCKTGTEIRVRWPDCACSILTDAEARFLQIADDFAWLNPSLTLEVVMVRPSRPRSPATRADWAKWKPSDPTSPHWYDPERFERLIAAYVAHDADNGRIRTVREFVAEFRGLSGSAKGKAVLAAVGLSREPLSRLVVDGRVDPVLSRRLLEAMQEHSSPVKPASARHYRAGAFRSAFRGCPLRDGELRLPQDRRL